MTVQIKLMTITLLVFFLNIQLKGEEDGCKLVSDSIPQFQILDTIEILQPRILYVSEKVRSIGYFTRIVLSEIDLGKINRKKKGVAEDYLKMDDCYVYKSYEDLIDLLWQSTRDTALFYKPVISWKFDSCVTVNKNTNCCFRKSGRFIIAREALEHYNYYRVLEHKRLKIYKEYVLVAFPL